MKNLLWTIALATGWLALPAGPATAEDKGDQKALQGTWKIEKADATGENPPPQEEIKKMSGAKGALTRGRELRKRS